MLVGAVARCLRHGGFYYLMETGSQRCPSPCLHFKRRRPCLKCLDHLQARAQAALSVCPDLIPSSHVVLRGRWRVRELCFAVLIVFRVAILNVPWARYRALNLLAGHSISQSSSRAGMYFSHASSRAIAIISDVSMTLSSTSVDEETVVSRLSAAISARTSLETLRAVHGLHY